MAKVTEREQAIGWAAARVIEELSGPVGAAALADIMESVRRTGSADFVFVEEGVDGYLEEFEVAPDPATHRAACGEVFRWLRAVHHVPPPRWFTGCGEAWMDDSVCRGNATNTRPGVRHVCSGHPDGGCVCACGATKGGR